MARDLLDRLRPHAEELGCTAELGGVEDLLEHGTGAHRQLAFHERNGDLAALAAEIAAKARP
jgi:carboxylate-amine ligase